MPSQISRNVILGFGNQVLSDDVAGIKVVRYILRKYPALCAFEIVEAGTLNYRLTRVLENARNLVVVEAAQLEQRPGTISVFTGADMDRILNRRRRNSNETALAEMIEIARLARRLPPQRALITIEPKKVSWGGRLSASVRNAIPRLAEDALSIMSHWTGVPFQDLEPPLNAAPESAKDFAPVAG